MIFLSIIILLFVTYSVLMIYYWQSWNAIPVFTVLRPVPAITVSVIIPARNEENNIAKLLTALNLQSYPAHLVEIIVVNDHSTDKTAEIVQQFANVRLISLDANAINSYKKKAIEVGIAAATGELIVTTDADCCPPKEWLLTLVSFKEEKNAVFIAAPVAINCSSSLVQVFQAMDFMVLQGITGAAVYRKQLSMCNGANLAYERTAFYEVNGFTGIDQVASGDDMLLMHKIAQRSPDRVHYLKTPEAIVSTLPVTNWKAFFSQRIRWASKARFYTDKRIFFVLLLVYLVNLSFPALLVAGFVDSRYWYGIFLFWIVKTIVELPFFAALASFFHKQWAIRLFFFFQPLHIIYTLISGLFGQFGKYEWKGRKVK